MPDAEPIRLRRVGGAHAAAARVWERGGLLSAALWPAELAFLGASSLRNALYDAGVLRAMRVGVPVVSIGNLTVGGAGKTPFTRWIVERLRARGRRPAILHRGSGEDEPALHASWQPDVPVRVGADRVAGARAAAAEGADVIVLDDGFQHRRLARDVDIVLVAAETGLGPVRLLPRGPWRERLPALRRADLAVVTCRTADAATAARVARRLAAVDGAPPVATAVLETAGWRAGGAGGAGGPPRGAAFAVTSIASPDAFAENARRAGAAVAAGLAFPDHHPFDAHDAARILSDAAGRALVTTEKDAVKLVPLLPETPLWVLLQRVRIEEGAAAVEEVLDRVV
jgi:tetraacyldisaccharide 4'-kinase